MIKYACNCFHGLKVGFGNEIGNVCKAVGVDSHVVMRLFCEDRKLNISLADLRPVWSLRTTAFAGEGARRDSAASCDMRDDGSSLRS